MTGGEAPTLASARQGAAPVLACRLAGPEVLGHHFDIRHEVFVNEQRLFAKSDVDERDADPETLHVLGYCDGVPVGAVRLFRIRGGLWQGDRLAVLPPYRMVGLGSPLVRLAVAEATARGGKRMVAHIQLANVAFFRRLGWELDGPPEMYHGAPHQPMAVTLG
jgi:putative N-acetyltransferase (TIGR04045 family)